MKIQPVQQIADYMDRFRAGEARTLPPIARRIRAVKWRLWHGGVDHAIRDLEELLEGLKPDDAIEDLSTSRLRSLGAQLLTYVASNRSAIINYGKHYRAGLRVASTLAESVVNSIVGERMAKSQQMRWSLQGAHMLMQVRTADIDAELRDRLRAEFRKPDPSVLHCSARSRHTCAPLDLSEIAGLSPFDLRIC
jgi:hypothetical protein